MIGLDHVKLLTTFILCPIQIKYMIVVILSSLKIIPLEIR